MWNFSKVSTYNKREIPLDVELLIDITVVKEPENEYQALMEAPPGATIPTSKAEVDEIREIVRDCVELLLDQDKFIIHAINYEQITYEELGSRLGCSAPHAWRLTQIAYKHLEEVLQIDGRLAKKLDGKYEQ